MKRGKVAREMEFALSPIHSPFAPKPTLDIDTEAHYGTVNNNQCCYCLQSRF